MPDVIELADGDRIDAPGFYRMSLDRHHGQPCVGPSVTSGVLRKMELQTPADVWAFHLLNPDRWPSEDKPALRMGRAMASLIEGGVQQLKQHFTVVPEDAPRKPDARQLKAYAENRASDVARTSVEFWDTLESDPRDVLPAAEWELIVTMGGVLTQDPAASAVMAGLPEMTMAWQDEATGIWVLARPDTVSFDGATSDFKKMSARGGSFDYRLVDRNITKHGYHQQMALAAEGLERLTGSWPTSVGVVAQSDKPPHHVILREIADEELRMGQFLNNRAIKRFHECLTSGHWPGPGEDTGAYIMPDWYRSRILEEMQVQSGE